VKALPLWQPYASLVAMGAKRIETRAYPPGRIGLRLGQRIAIHATLTKHCLDLCCESPFDLFIPDLNALPLGALVATAVITRCRRITEEWAGWLEQANQVEFAFGDYTAGRYAWALSEVKQLPHPVPFKGSQGSFDIPDHLVGFDEPQGTLEGV
jgi:activating signal cointegrator 1